MKNFLISQFEQIKQKGITLALLKIKILIKIIFIYPVAFLLLPINIVILLISKFIIFRFAEIPTNRMGHFALEVDIYLTRKRSETKYKTRVVDIFCKQYYDGFVCNHKFYISTLK